MKKIILKYNIHLACAALLAANRTNWLFDLDLTIYQQVLISLIAFCSTAAIYNYYRRNSKPAWLLPLIVVVICYLLLMNETVVILGVNIFLCLLYQSPLKKIYLRRHSIMKPLIISLCWINTIILLPVLCSNVNWNQFLITDFGLFFLLNKWMVIFGLCIITDLMQLKVDNINGLNSFPLAYGIKTSRYTVALLGFTNVMMAWVQFYYFKNNPMTIYFLISYLILLGIVLLSINIKANKITGVLADIFIGIDTLVFMIILFFK